MICVKFGLLDLELGILGGGDLHAAFATLDSKFAVLGGVDAQYWDSALRRFGFGIWNYGFAILNSGLVVVQI